MPAAVIAAIVTAGAQTASTIINNRGASNAAKTQADAVNRSADIQAKAQADALAAEKEQINFDRQQAAAKEASRAPYVQASNQSLAALSGKLGLPAFNPNAQPQSIAPGQGPTLA